MDLTCRFLDRVLISLALLMMMKLYIGGLVDGA